MATSAHMIDDTPIDHPATEIRRENLAQDVVTYVREQILSGRLRPGMKIDQAAVAQSLGVSKIPVREALLVLASDGLVEIIPRRGAFVGRLTPADIMDHYAIFGLVAGLAAERATAALGEADLARLEELIEAMEATTDPDALGALNFRFHQTISRAGATHHLALVLRRLSEMMSSRFFEFSGGQSEDAIMCTHAEHRAILDALRVRDGDAAAKASATHFSARGQQAVDHLESVGFWRDAD